MTLARFKTVFLGLAIVAMVLVIGSLIVSGVLTSNAVFAQRAEKLEAAELFGDTQQRVLIGSPQNFLALDAKAFMEGTGDQGAKLLNDTYLRENNIYPIQVKTVEFFRNATVLASILGGGLMLLLWWLGHRSSQKIQRTA